MKTTCLNFIFFLSLIHISLVNLRKTQQQPSTQMLQQNLTIPSQPQLQPTSSPSPPCQPYLNSVDIKSIISSVQQNSSSFPSKYYFIFFFNNNSSYTQLKTFASEVSRLFPEIVDITFYCQSINLKKYSQTQVYGILNSTFVENKKMEKLSYEYLQFLMNTFDLKKKFKDQIAQESNSMASIKGVKYEMFLQKHVENKAYEEKTKESQQREDKKLRKESQGFVGINMKAIEKEQPKANDHRVGRLLWSLLLVLVVSLSLFFLVKYSIDWATSSKTELNKQKDQRLREVAEVFITKGIHQDN